MKNFFKKITCPIFSSKGRRLFEKAAGFACIVFSLSAFTSSCDSGLGSAVDTQAPVLVIETPESRSVNNGDVLVGGTWSDDKAVVKVTISVVLKSSTQGNAETESAESSNVSYLYENVEAVVKSDKTWQYVFATNTSEETEGRKVLPDGKYDITVHAFDAAGHDSGGSTRYFEVDTTPPLFFAEKPNKFESTGSPSSYGRSVKLLGNISEDKGIKELKVDVYDYDTKEKIELPKSTYTDFTTSSVNITLAEYDPAVLLLTPEDAGYDEEKWYAAKNFQTLYGDKDESNENWDKQKKYLMLLSAEDETGNKTSRVFSKDAVNATIKKSLNIIEVPDQSVIKSIVNGSYSGNEYSEEQKERIREILSAEDIQEKNYVSSENDMFFFSINSTVNPTYSVTGCGDHGRDKNKIKTIPVEGTIDFKIEEGLDQKGIVPSSVKVYLTQISPDTLLPKEEPVEVSSDMIRLSSDSTVTLADKIESYTTDPFNEANLISGESYQFNLNGNDNALNLKAGKFYQITIEGNDTDSNDVISYSGDYFFAILAQSNLTFEKLFYTSSAAAGVLKEMDNDVYVNGSTEFTVYGAYEDVKNGVRDLEFSLKNEAFTVTEVKYSTAAISSELNEAESQIAAAQWKSYDDFTEDTTEISSFKVRFTPDSNGEFKAIGLSEVSSNDSVPAEVEFFSVTYDETAPDVDSCRLSGNYSYEAAEAGNGYYKKYYVNNKKAVFSLEGTASDDKKLESVSLKAGSTIYTNINDARSWRFENIDLTGLTGDSVVFELKLTDAAGNVQNRNVLVEFDVNGPEGLHYAASNNKDIVFRIGEADNEDPALANGDFKTARANDGSALAQQPQWNNSLDKDVGGKYAAGTYGKSETVKIRGNFLDEGSGLKEIWYRFFDSEPDEDAVLAFEQNYLTDENARVFYPLTETETRRVFYKEKDDQGNTYVTFRNVESNFKTSISNFKEGNNYLVLVAVDNVGNARADTLDVNYGSSSDGNGWNGGTAGEDDGIPAFSLNVDIKVPEIVSDERFYSSTTYTNGTRAVEIFGTVTDVKPSAGIKSIELEVNGKKITKDSTVYGTVSFTPTSSDSALGAEWTATINANVFTGLTADQPINVTATVTDDADEGNSQTVVVGTISVDITPPEVVISSPNDADTTTAGVQVNKIISISGTAKDSKGLEETDLQDASKGKVNLYYTTKSSLGNVSSITNFTSGTNPANSWVKYSDAEVGINWTVSGVNTETLASGLTNHTGTVWLTAAANDKAGNTGYAKPFAVIVNQDSDKPVIRLTNIENVRQNESMWLKNTNVLYFAVTDDDGNVQEVKYKDGNSDYKTVQNLSKGSGSFALPDGSHLLSFYVRDNEGTVFETSASLDPYILGASDTVKQRMALSLAVDKTSPVSKEVEYSYYDSDAARWTDFADEPSSVGGKRTKLKVQLKAGDENDIESVTAKINGASYAGVCTVAPVLDQTEKYFSTWQMEVPAAGIATGNHILTLEIKDKAELTKTDTIMISVDQTAPDLKMISPSDSEKASGKVIAYGSVSGAVSVEYALSPSKDHVPDGVRTITSWSGPEASGTCSNCKPAYASLREFGNSWKIYFDDDIDASSGNHARLLNRYLIDYGITTSDRLEANDSTQFADYVYLYLWLKAYDEVGNKSEKYFRIYLDPQGDRPEISISYPNADGATLSNEVSIYGTASDTKGNNVGVDSAWLQIISKAHGTDTTTTYGTFTCNEENLSAGFTNFNFTKNDLDYMAKSGLNVYNMRTYKGDGSDTKWTAGSSSIAAGYTASDYAAVASLKGKSWSITVNGNESFNFNPTEASLNGKNPVAVRIYARDKDNKFSSKQERLFAFDADTPEIKDLYVVQSAGAALASESTASRQYISDMFVKGAWYITGTAYDKDEIKSLKIVYNTEENLEEVLISDGSVASGFAGKVSLSNDGTTAQFKYALKNPDGTLLSDQSQAGSVELKIVAGDGAAHTGSEIININYDNKPPVIAEENSRDFNISEEIYQSNSWYTFGSSVSEDPINNIGQSGFAYTAFWFERNNTVSGTRHIYDILQSKANAPVNLTGITVRNMGSETSSADNTIVYDSGLYWYRKNVGRSAGNLNVLTGVDSRGIRQNALVKIGGALYRITGVEDGAGGKKEITIDGYPESGETHAYVAIAGLVDNTAESEGYEIQADGYYEEPDNDDGDRMMENVESSGTSWTWEAKVCSKNISDGPVVLHYVAFDEAANFTEGSVNAYIMNNRPRIAGFTLKTDYDNDNIIDETVTEFSAAEYTASVNSVTGTSGGKSVYDPDKDSLSLNRNSPLKTEFIAGSADEPVKKIRGYTTISPEVVGGNGAIYYDYSATAGSTLSGRNNTAVISSGTQNYTIGTASDIKIQLGDLLALGDTECTPFTIRFWDSTEGTQSFTDSQNATLKLYFGVNAAAVMTPVVKIRPFYWKGLNKNSVYGSGSVKSYSQLKGHIELEDDWTAKDSAGNYITEYDGNASGTELDADPKVSGQIVVEGSAHDDKVISSMAVVINGTSYAAASYSAGNGLVSSALESAYSSAGFWFEVISSEVKESGHDVQWKLYLNTEKFGVKVDASVAVKATNFGRPVVASGTARAGLSGTASYAAGVSYANGTAKTNTPGTVQTAENAETAFYRMDIVPYITDITTKLSDYNAASKPDVYDRTALGHYAVYISYAGGETAADTETNKASAEREVVTVAGFNLSGGTVTFEEGVSDNTVALVVKLNDGVPVTDKNNGAPHYTFTVPAGSKSGNVSVTVNDGTKDVVTLNNKNNNNSRGRYGYETDEVGVTTDTLGTVAREGNYNTYTNFYNRLPNNVNNNNLTDDVVFDVWDVNTRAAAAYNNGKADNAVMKVSPVSGMIGFAFSNGSERFSMGGTVSGTEYSYKSWNRTYDYMDYNTFAYAEDGHTFATSAGGDLNAGSDTPRWDWLSLMTDRWGVVGDNTNSNKTGTKNVRINGIGQRGNAANPDDVDDEGNALEVRNIRKDRFRSSTLVTRRDGSATDIYYAYYDLLNDEIRFKAGKLNDSVAVGGFGQFPQHGKDDIETYTEGANNCQILATNTSDEDSETYGISKTLGSAGEYVAAAVTSDNAVCLVWHDKTDLKFTYNKTPLTYTAGPNAASANDEKWQEPVTVISGAGEYCQIEVGGDNSIHIAAYNGSDLCYVYIPYDDENNQPDLSGRISCKVDTYLDTGENISLDVAGEVIGGTVYYVPHISYWAAYPEKPRYAYISDPASFFTEETTEGTVVDRFTGVWECGILPTGSSVKEGKIGIGLWKESKVIGNKTVHGIRAASASGTSYATPDNGMCYGNGTENAVLGYVSVISSSVYNIETAQKR